MKRHLRDTPYEKNALLAQPGFVVYQAKSRAAHQQQTTKSQGKVQVADWLESGLTQLQPSYLYSRIVLGEQCLSVARLTLIAYVLLAGYFKFIGTDNQNLV